MELPLGMGVLIHKSHDKSEKNKRPGFNSNPNGYNQWRNSDGPTSRTRKLNSAQYLEDQDFHAEVLSAQGKEARADAAHPYMRSGVRVPNTSLVPQGLLLKNYNARHSPPASTTSGSGD